MRVDIISVIEKNDTTASKVEKRSAWYTGRTLKKMMIKTASITETTREKITLLKILDRDSDVGSEIGSPGSLLSKASRTLVVFNLRASLFLLGKSNVSLNSTKNEGNDSIYLSRDRVRDDSSGERHDSNLLPKVFACC